MVAEHNKSALHIERIRLKFGFTRKTDEQREDEYIAKLNRIESKEINVKRVIINRNEASA